jgi:enoyl-[acyl-carrier protein] reductase / trans-2-enoyl-CoA reductase (NAD+)
MIIQPKVRGFVCVTAHPNGCASHVSEEIEYVRRHASIPEKPRAALIIGASTGYGLSSRVTAAFGCQAKTIGVFLERPPGEGKPASAGWYNMAAFEKFAEREGIYARSINGDAFSDEIKERTLGLIERELGQVDLVVYSLASPRRTHPRTGVVHKSVIKPIGETFTEKNVDVEKGVVDLVSVPPATPEEIEDTVAVMGGEDWEMWIDTLITGGVLAPDAKTVAYSYIGPRTTWPIYHHGTIGRAKADLEARARRLDERLRPGSGRAFVSINKAVVTQASSAIPVVPLYIAILFRVMKEKGLHEGCIEQTHRLFADHLYSGGPVALDEGGRLRLDDLEMRPDVQEEVARRWNAVETGNLAALSDIESYRGDFLKLFGFNYPGIDYTVPADASFSFAEA